MQALSSSFRAIAAARIRDAREVGRRACASSRPRAPGSTGPIHEETMIPFAPAKPTLRCAAPRGAVATLVVAASGWLVPPVAAADTLRIAAARAPVSLPLYVAQQRGFFADEQLDVVITDCVGGARCMRQVLDDK